MSSRKIPCLNLCSCQEAPKGVWFCLLNNLLWGTGGLLLDPSDTFSSPARRNPITWTSLHSTCVLQPPDYLGSSPLDELNFINSFLSATAQNWTQYPGYGLARIKNRGIITSFDLLAAPLLLELSLLLAFSDTKVHYSSWACYPPGSPGSFFSRENSSHLVSCLYCSLGLIQLRCTIYNYPSWIIVFV